MSETSFGKFLRRLRLERGYDKVNVYLRKYKLPITDVYYRNLEGGSKVLSLDSADALCQALEADPDKFFYCLLKDILPAKVMQSLISSASHMAIDGNEELADDSQQQSEAYRKVLSQFYAGRNFDLSGKVIEFFHEHLELLPLLIFIMACSPNKVSQAELDRFAKNSGIETPINEIIQHFEKINLFTVETTSAVGSPEISIPFQYLRVLNDQSIVPHLMLKHTERALQAQRSDSPFSQEGAFRYWSFLPINQDKFEEFNRRVLDLMTEITAANDVLATPGTEQFFVSFIAMRLPEYAQALKPKEALDKQT